MRFSINKIIEGEYYPGYFIMGIQKKFFDGVSWDTFTKGELATFVHEYVHYLQDISMTTGITQFLHQAKIFQMYMALFQKVDNIKIPINLEKDGTMNAYAQTELLNFYEGGNFQNKKFHHFDCIKLENEELIEGILDENSDYSGDKKIQQVSIYYDDLENPTVLGSIYICESMSYLIEKICFGAEVRNNEWPYNVCEMVCNSIYQDLLKKPELIVVICEYALMHEDCGLAFYQAINLLSKYDIDTINIQDVMQLLEKWMIQGINKYNLTYEELDVSINYLYLSDIPQTKIANMYVKKLFEAGHNYRNGKHFFISEILLSDEPCNVIKYWVNLFFFPLLIDQASHEFLGSFKGLEIIPVPLAIKDYYASPSKGCPLMGYCKYSENNNLDNNICKNTPWKQCERKEKCPFAFYLSVYGLDNKTFIVDNKFAFI